MYQLKNDDNLTVLSSQIDDSDNDHQLKKNVMFTTSLCNNCYGTGNVIHFENITNEPKFNDLIHYSHHNGNCKSCGGKGYNKIKLPDDFSLNSANLPIFFTEKKKNELRDILINRNLLNPSYPKHSEKPNILTNDKSITCNPYLCNICFGTGEDLNPYFCTTGLFNTYYNNDDDDFSDSSKKINQDAYFTNKEICSEEYYFFTNKFVFNHSFDQLITLFSNNNLCWKCKGYGVIVH